MYYCPTYKKKFDSLVAYSEADIGYFDPATCPYCHLGDYEVLETHSLTHDEADQ